MKSIRVQTRGKSDTDLKESDLLGLLLYVSIRTVHDQCDSLLFSEVSATVLYVCIGRFW